ncbi:hypothetical protein J6TS2_50960 [Heyndrickxia sporothermodurans]|nr:hypothetical protein J6TS2_50960 [Heyndrickxia sporothermodurans]
MEVYIDVTKDNRVDGWGSTSNGKNILITVPNNHEVLSNPHVFVYKEGKLSKDEAYQQELLKESHSNE